RIDFLKTVAGNKKLSDGIRAAAAVGLCRIYQGQGLNKEARLAAEQALRFDAHEPAALQMLAQITKRTTPVDMFEIALGVFAANPRSLYVSRNLAQSLQGAGLYDKSLLFYNHALAIAGTTRPPDDETEMLLVGYLNAMLDAGQAQKAITFIAPYLKRYNRSLKLHGLMVEACRSLGADERAATYLEVMAGIYKPLTSPALKRSGSANAELAWFNLIFRSRPGDAIQWANAAALSAGDDLFVQRVLGAAELATGKVDSGVKRLASLVKKDQYAAAILAGHYYRSGASEKGAKALAEGAGDVRTGPAWRALKKLANEQKVKLPPVSYGKKMQNALDKLPEYLLEMGRHPEKYVSVKLAVKKTKVLLGEAVTVTVTIRNISK
ncbi:MAG: hypothetical protein KAV00_14855, partial [Phycisphaerae bacterium]|nr:hypothetical protein [Phycisphaerae bacterium]